MQRGTWVGAMLLLLSPAAPAFTLRDTLGEDQRSETLQVWIDDREPVVLKVDAKHPQASVELPVDGDEHRYRLAGESIALDGSRTELAGSGLIVTTARMDRIAEAPETAAAALAEYRALYAALARVAPAERIAGLDPGTPQPATAEQVAAAEKRLGITLPPDYVRFITEVGALRFAHGDFVAARVYAPQEIGTLADLAVDEVRENGWDDDFTVMEQRILKRFPRAGKDIVLDVFSLDEPTVLVRGGKCPAGQVPIVLPESDYQLLVMEPGDNPFMALIDYEDDIVGEMQCFDYDRLFAYSLHDQLVDFGDDVIYVRDDGSDASAAIARGAASEGKVWVQLSDHNGD